VANAEFEPQEEEEKQKGLEFFTFPKFFFGKDEGLYM
jgi:hypothetical protein